MKYLRYICFLFIGITIQLNAQLKEHNTLRDSLVKENLKATAFFEKSKIGESIELANKVLLEAEENDFYSVQARSCTILGNSYSFLERDSLSFHYLFKARDISLKNNNRNDLIGIYNNIGTNYRDMDSIDIATKYFKSAIELAETINHREGIIYPATNLASLAISEDENYEYGIKSLIDVLKIIREYGGKIKKRAIVGEIYFILYYSYDEIGEKEKSLYYFKKCKDFAEENKYVSLLADLYYERSYIDKKRKDYKAAFNFLELHTSLYDSVMQIREFDKAKQIEAENFLRENNEKLMLVQKEKEFQEASTNKANRNNIILGLFSMGLLLSLFLFYRSNKKLDKAKKRAEKLSKVKSDFYSEISHELRTPLYAVIEISRLLLKENLDNKHKEYLESLNFSGNHLLTLVNNVLELNKVESGKFKLQTLKFNLKNLITNIIDSLEFALTDNGNKIHLNYDNGIPLMLSGDSLKLSQVFINLISNAIKFTSNGNIYVTVRMINENDSSVKLFLEVKDDGLGVPKEKQIQIFEDFYQENSKVDNSYKGTGLGLSIVKRIINAMGSDIVLESEIGKGTSFNFELQFSKVNNDIIVQKEDSESLYKKLKNIKVLVVDDNKINQLVTKKILSQFEMISTIVSSGIEAIEVMQKEGFDCVLMDLHMPELDGYQTTSRIRVFNKTTPIIALTAASTEEVESKINPSEMNGYIMKPFITEDFIETIHDSIYKKESLPIIQTA